MNTARCATFPPPIHITDPENNSPVSPTRPLRLQRIPDAPPRWSSFASTATNSTSSPSSLAYTTPAPMLSSFASSPWGSGISSSNNSGSGAGRRNKAVVLGSHSAVPPKHRRVFDYSSFPHPHPSSYTNDTPDDEHDDASTTTTTLHYSYPPLTPPHRPTLSANAISPLTSSSYSFLLEHRDGELSGYSYTPPEYYTNAYDIPFTSLFPTPPHPSLLTHNSLDRDHLVSPYISPIQHQYSPLVRVDLSSPDKKHVEQKQRVSVRLIVSKLRKQQQQAQLQHSSSSPVPLLPQSSILQQRSILPIRVPPAPVVRKNNAKKRKVEQHQPVIVSSAAVVEEEEEEDPSLGDDEDASGESDPEATEQQIQPSLQPTSVPDPPSPLPVTPLPNTRNNKRPFKGRQKQREEEGEQHPQKQGSSSSPFVLTGRTIYSVASDHSHPPATKSNRRNSNGGDANLTATAGRKRPYAEVEHRSLKRVKAEDLSPLTPLASSSSSSSLRPFPPAASSSNHHHHHHQTAPPQDPPEVEHHEPLPIREFPPIVQEIKPDVYERFYRRFWISSFAIPGKEVMKPPPSASPNAARSHFDLYTPRFTKGRGPSKLGLCPICIEPRERGGEGRAFWGAMKVSAYNYHMQYYHGISPQSYLPFSPPLAFRLSAVMNPAKMEKKEIMEGKCHKCEKWVAVDGVKDVEVKVRELFWWKHAAMCHRGSRVEDEGGWEKFDGEDLAEGAAAAAAALRKKARGRGVWVEDQIWEEACRSVDEDDDEHEPEIASTQQTSGGE